MFGSLILMAAVAVGSPEVQVNTVDGGVTKGELQQLSTDGIELKTENGDAKLPLSQVLNVVPQSMVPPAVEKPAAWIELIDGSKLATSEFTVEDGSANLIFDADKTAKISTTAIHSVRFSRPDDPASAVWPKNVGADATGDLLVVRKKDQIDFMEGSVGEVDENYVILKVDGETYPVSRAKVDGLVYFHKMADKLPDPVCVVENASGWRLYAKELSFVPPNNTYPAGRFEVTTLSGDKFFFLSGDQVTKLDFSAGKVAFLSDLEPESTQWTPYLDFGNAVPAMAQYYAPLRDEGREHQPIRLGGKTYNKGLALYSRTALEYRVPAGMKQFKATAGIDDAVREAGHVRLSISADGKSLFDRALTGKDAPVDVDLNVAGAKRLSILVDYGDQFDAGDFLDLAEARMLK
ncbi:MAG TPA: NPCBM/NEW2 domain-containing protein [Pirellulales bacterium]|nr:NPCBM/NEW2 domain-containing protein [Pirellulales bacterium]